MGDLLLPFRRDPSTRTRSTARRVIGLLAPHRPFVLVLGLMVLTASSLDIAVPFLTQHVIDQIVRAIRSSQSLGLPVLLRSAVSIFMAVVTTRFIRSAYNYRLFKLISRVEDDVKRTAYSNYLSLDLSAHAKLNSGQIIGSLDRGATATFVVLYEVFGQSFASSIIVFAGVVTALLTINPGIALAVFLPLPLYLLVIGRYTSKMRELEGEVGSRFEIVSKECYDVASNIATVKNFLQEHREIDRQKSQTKLARKPQHQAEWTWAVIENIQTWMSTLGRVIVIAAGGYMALTGRCTIGQYVLLISLQDMLQAPMAQLSTVFPKLRRNLARAQGMFDVLDSRPKLTDAAGATALAPFHDAIQFRDVSFKYEGSDRTILNRVNLTIPAGATVALIGRSGTGKSTLAKLLLRCYDPQHGAILVDGINLRHVTQASLRRQIAVVSQEIELFSRTIAENIAYGRPEATRAEIEHAAQLALAHPFIMRCEQGYDTKVGERGTRLSGGERQRLGIARAILQNPRILILDEATSHLDTESERLIQQATERLAQDRTCLIIAHRLSTIKHADLVVVFGEHGIEAIGSHQTLWHQSETYRKLMLASQDEGRGAMTERIPELVENAAA